MDRERYQRVKEIYLAAQELPAPDRDRFLDRECGDDRELRREVERILADEPPATVALGAPVQAQASRLVEQRVAEDTPAPGRRGIRPVWLALGILLIVSLLGAALLLGPKPVDRPTEEDAPPAGASPAESPPPPVDRSALGRRLNDLALVVLDVGATDLANELLQTCLAMGSEGPASHAEREQAAAIARQARSRIHGRRNLGTDARIRVLESVAAVLREAGRIDEAARCSRQVELLRDERR